MTKAELQWLRKFLDNYEYVLDAYPELFKQEEIDEFRIARQIIEDKE